MVINIFHDKCPDSLNVNAKFQWDGISMAGFSIWKCEKCGILITIEEESDVEVYQKYKKQNYNGKKV